MTSDEHAYTLVECESLDLNILDNLANKYKMVHSVKGYYDIWFGTPFNEGGYENFLQFTYSSKEAKDVVISTFKSRDYEDEEISGLLKKLVSEFNPLVVLDQKGKAIFVENLATH
ncbi:hypothetical protein KY334_02995 [Candidatus Woesearchaeota archaeon]|nr:hypothetical protein [Candidatus Woesearchaeota archaeon]